VSPSEAVNDPEGIIRVFFHKVRLEAVSCWPTANCDANGRSSGDAVQAPCNVPQTAKFKRDG
jgi:hypothetical protein